MSSIKCDEFLGWSCQNRKPQLTYTWKISWNKIHLRQLLYHKEKNHKRTIAAQAGETELWIKLKFTIATSKPRWSNCTGLDDRNCKELQWSTSNSNGIGFTMFFAVSDAVSSIVRWNQYDQDISKLLIHTAVISSCSAVQRKNDGLGEWKGFNASRKCELPVSDPFTHHLPFHRIMGCCSSCSRLPLSGPNSPWR